MLAASFLYFFKVDRTIQRKMVPVMNNPQTFITHLANVKEVYHGVPPIKVEWYFETPFKLKKARDVSHYTD